MKRFCISFSCNFDVTENTTVYAGCYPAPGIFATSVFKMVYLPFRRKRAAAQTAPKIIASRRTIEPDDGMSM